MTGRAATRAPQAMSRATRQERPVNMPWAMMDRTAGRGSSRRIRHHRWVLVGVAYRMLGQVADAEDVVQVAWLRWVRAPMC